MAPQAEKGKREAKDWRWLLWDSDVAHKQIHPQLGAGWTAVLKEACCVRKYVDKERVERLCDDIDDPLRLWLPELRAFGGIVPTVPLLEWMVARDYEPNARTFHMTARGGDMDAVRWLREHKCPSETLG